MAAVCHSCASCLEVLSFFLDKSGSTQHSARWAHPKAAAMSPLRATTKVLEDGGRALLLVVTQLQEPTVPVAVQPVDCVAEADTEVGTGLNVRGHGLEETVSEQGPRILNRIEVLRAPRVARHEVN